MKNKTKKIIAGLGVGLTLAGTSLFMTGCSMTEEQQNALNVITTNTETLVESFDSYLDGQNNKLDKETAYDMLKHARIKSQYILAESNICELNVLMKDELMGNKIMMNMHAIYDFSSNNKKMMVYHDYAEPRNDEIIIGNYNINDNTKSYMVNYVNDLPVLNSIDESWYANNINPNIDALAQTGIRDIEIEDITRVSVREDGSIVFNVIKTRVFKKSETSFSQIINFAEIVVKDYLFQKVSVQHITKEGTNASFEKDMKNEHAEDGYGSYYFAGNIISVINLEADYKYGNDVDLSDLNSKIADIDAKIANGELSLN